MKESLEAFGLPAELASHFEQEKTKVWPVHFDVLQVFSSLITQWRPNKTGIDYSVIPVVMDLHEIKTENRNQMFADLKVMETAALKQLHKQTQQ